MGDPQGVQLGNNTTTRPTSKDVWLFFLIKVVVLFLVSGNDIHSNNEAGLDIRKNADPIVQVSLFH